MKRYLISTIAVLVVLSMTMSVYAQGQVAGGEGRGGGRGAGMRGGRGTQQLQDAIAAIETQLAELKKNVEAQAAMPRGRGGAEGETPSEEEIAKMREQRTKMREQQQTAVAAIEQQVKILKGNQLQVEHQAEVDELQAIADSATKEKATATAKMVQDIIAKRTKAFEDTVEKLGIRLRGGRGGQRGQGQGGGGQQRRGQQQQ
jgi:hypothetical protein